MDNVQPKSSSSIKEKEVNRLNAKSALKLLTSESEKMRREAFNWFYETYSDFAYLVCARLARDNNFDDPEDYAYHAGQDVLQKFVLHLKDFDYDSSQTPKGQNSIFKRYITNVSVSVFADFCKAGIKDREFRQRNLESIESDQMSGESHSYSKKQVDSEFRRRQHYLGKMKQLMERLTEREREIMTACLNHSKVEGGNLILDKAIKKELMNKYDIKSNSVDQLKKRIIGKLRKLALESED